MFNHFSAPLATEILLYFLCKFCCMYLIPLSRSLYDGFCRVRRQQMLQALVEFQCKAVNTQQTVTITDAIHVAGVLHAITSRTTRIVRVGKRMRDRRALPKARPNSAGPTYRRQRFPPYYMRRPYGRRPQYSSPPVRGEVMEGADNQGAGEQGRPVRQNMYRGYRPRIS